MNMKKIIIALAILFLTAGVCSADNYVGGLPLTTVKEGTVSGGVYSDSFYGIAGQATGGNTITKTFTIPDYTDVEWAMLLTTVYCGNMQSNYPLTATTTFNGEVLETETLDVPFVYLPTGNDNIALGGGLNDPYKIVNDHVNRVSSDYMMWYDVTDSVKAGENTAEVTTELLTGGVDGRIKLITLIVAYNDGSSKEIHYWINRGHDADTYYKDELPEINDYIGSTDFVAGIYGAIQDASLTAVHMASQYSKDGSYTFNGKSIPSGTPQGTSSGSNTWDVTDSFIPSGTNTMTYDRTGTWYKIVLGILTAEYEVTPVEIDIKPGSFPNSINLGSQGTVTVAIFSSTDFDATTVNPLTVTLANADVKLKGKGTPIASNEDINGDGILDLVVHVSTEALGLSETDTEATLRGQTYDGTYIEGTDSVRIVP